MIFRTWITDLTKLQSVVNNIKNIETWANGSTKLLNPNVVNNLSSAINGLNLQQAQLVLSTKNLTQEQMNQVLVQAGLVASENKIQAELLQSALVQSSLSTEKQKAILTELSLMDAKTGEMLASKACTKEELLNILATKGITGANAEAIISTLGLSNTNKKATLSFGLFTKATWSQVKAQFALMAANPITWIMTVIGVILGAVKAIDALTISFDEAIEKTKSSKQELDQLTSDISDLNQELETTKDRIEELLEKANSGTISLLEEEELNNLREQNDELQREIALKEKLAEIDAKEAAENAAYSLTYRTDDNIWDDEYNATDRIDKLQKYVDSAIFYQDKLSEINQQILDIEESATDNNYKEDSVYKDLIKHQKEYQKGLKKVEEQMSSTYKELSEEDDGLYYNGKVIEGYEDLVERLDTVYTSVELYLDEDSVKDITKDYFETIKNKLVESGLSEEISNAVLEGFSEEELNSIVNSDSIDWSQFLNLDEATDIIENIRGQLASINPDKSNDLVFPTLSSSVQQLAIQLEPQFAKLGEAYKSIFTTNGFSLYNVDNSMLEDLRQSFAEIEEEIGVTFDATKLDTFFDTLTSNYVTSEKGAKQVQQAFNELATAYFYSTETLEQLNSETADAIEKQLEEMGVVNAKEVVYDTLNSKTETVALQEQFLAQTGIELANASNDKVTSFLNEANASDIARAYLFQLKVAELEYNGTGMDASAKIAELGKLAEAYGQTAIAAKIATIEKNAESSHTGVTTSDYQSVIDDINNAIRTPIDFGNISSSSKAGKEAGDAYVDAFEEELSDLSQLRDNGVITEKEYLDSLRTLYEKYFENKLGYEKEYAKYQRQYLEGYKSLYESALSGISTLLGNQIDGYKDAKDAAVSSLTDEKDARLAVIDSQKEQLEAQKDLIDEQIEAKQKLIDDIQNEIDAMKEANSERQRQLDLQKAQYELERMQHQRTILQYSEENGMQYVQNDEGLRTAKENVDSAKFEIEISNKEKNISLLEDEISLLEEQKDAIQNQMDLLDKQAEQIESYYSKMISETEAYYDSLINNMERQKSKWEEIAEIENIARAYSDLEQVAGGMGYSVQDILSGNEQAFEDFKSRYIALLSDLNNNSSFSEGLSYATSGIAQGIDNLEASAATVSESTGKIAANIGEVNTNAEALSSSLSNINDSLSGFSETDNITAAADAFSKLGQAIQSVADALNISEDGTIGSLTGALKSLCEMPLCQTDDDKNGGILSKFQALKTAVTDVTNAISGGGSSASDSGDGGNSSSPGTSSGAAGNNSGGLAGAIASLKSAATDALGGNGNDESEGQSEGSGIIAQFGQLKNAVTDTTEAIGSGDSKQKKKSKGNSKNGNLISSITSLGSTASEILTGDGNDEDKSGGVIGRFEQFKDVIGEANEHVTGIATGLHDIDDETVECTIKVNVEQNGELPAYSKGILAPMKLESAEYKAKYSPAHAKGTGNYKGLPKSEKNALRSEYGQPELTVYPDGTTELTTQPTISDLPKGTVIFNETQTKEIFQNKGDALGGVSASGSTGQSSPGKPTLPPPQRPAFLVQQELQEECLAKTGSIMDKILSPLNMLSHNWKDMAGLTGNINHINHNGQNQSVNVGGINITCPGVTSQEVARQLGTELNHIFSGFHNYADQQSRVR